MKKLLLIMVAFVAFTSVASAQFEIKVNPLNALFGKYSVNAEYLMAENMGIEVGIDLISQNFDNAGIDLKRTGFGIGASFNYYFSPEDGNDKWYAFPYVAYKTRKWDDSFGSEEFSTTLTNFGAGVGVGYKWVTSSNIVFDLGWGLGRDFVNNYSYEGIEGYEGVELSVGVDIYSKLAIGYRFGG